MQTAPTFPYNLETLVAYLQARPFVRQWSDCFRQEGRLRYLSTGRRRSLAFRHDAGHLHTVYFGDGFNLDGNPRGLYFDQGGFSVKNGDRLDYYEFLPNESAA